MGVYDANFTCVPTPNNPIWIPVVVLQFVIVILGCISHSIFMSLVVFPQKFGLYLRTSFFFISVMMLIMLLTSTGAFLITLAHGKYIEDCEISAIELRKWLLYVHSFGEYFFVICELLGTIERVSSTFYPNFRKSSVFLNFFRVSIVLGAITTIGYIYFIRISFQKHLFAIGFGSLTLMEVANGIIVLILWSAAKKKYKTDKDAPLNISRSYAYCRCAAASVLARVLIITYVYLKIAGFFEGDADSGFYYLMNVLINLYCLVYPWTIMLCHRKIKSQIDRFVNEKMFSRHKRIHQEGEKTLYTIDGKQMNGMTTDDHFNQLNNFWNISAHPSPARIV